MREIKFRAWDKVMNKMFYDSELANGDILIIHINGRLELSDDDTYKISDFTLMQYTGLKDKNGAEIYEGDILSRKDWGMGGGHDPEERYEVELIDDYIYEEEQSWHFKVHLWGEWCEVIGNIYETPELLESGV